MATLEKNIYKKQLSELLTSYLNDPRFDLIHLQIEKPVRQKTFDEYDDPMSIPTWIEYVRTGKVIITITLQNTLKDENKQKQASTGP